MDIVIKAVDISRPPANHGAKSKRGRRHSQPQTLLQTSSMTSMPTSDSGSEDNKPEASFSRSFSSVLLRRRQSEEPSSSDPILAAEISSGGKPTLVKRFGFNVGTLSLGKTTTSPETALSTAGPLSAPVLSTASRPAPGLSRTPSLRSSASKRDGGVSPEGTKSSVPITPLLLRSPRSAKTPGSSNPKSTPTRTVGARLSSLLRMEMNSSSSSTEECSELHELDQILCLREHRNSLVERLLGAHQRNLSLSVRFVSGINEALRCGSSRDMKFKAKKLISIFLQPGSSYCIQHTGITKEVISSVQQGSADGLATLKALLLNDLLKHEIVLEFLKETTSLVENHKD